VRRKHSKRAQKKMSVRSERRRKRVVTF